MMITAALVFASLLAPSSPGDARDLVSPLLSPSLGVEEARRALAGVGARDVRFLRATADQALAEGLVRSRLLETLNRLGVAPVEKRSEGGALDASAFAELATFTVGGRRWVLAFGDAGRRGAAPSLRFALARIPVPVDGAPGSALRLHHLRDALDALAAAGVTLRPKTRDPWGNVLGWEGATSRGGRAFALYLPEEDELRVLFAL